MNKINILKRQLEEWIEFNKDRNLHLIDISELLSIIKIYQNTKKRKRKHKND